MEEKTGRRKRDKRQSEKSTEEEVKPKVEEVVIAKEETVAEDRPAAVIENIEVEKLTGPKILGKIDLPVDNDTRPVKDEKRKTKTYPD